MVMESHQRIKRFKVRLHFAICLFLVFCSLSLFRQVKDFNFLNYDDDLYVFENSQVKGGLTLKGICWSFKTTQGGNWHPLTWFSHMMDVEIYGLNPGRHHLTNVLFHTINTLLVFLIFRRMTGKEWESGVVAILFAIHPIHVESVAWVSERKDVLSTLFWMLTMWAYLRYVEQQNIRRYLVVLFIFALGLMAKPMLVSLPFVLLLLDFWPIRRFCFEETDGIQNKRSTILFLLGEKLPLFLFSFVTGVVTFFAQLHSGAVRSSEVYSLSIRMANALMSYALYIKKTIWPFDLAVPYPHPGMVPIGKFATAFLVLMTITFIVIKSGRRHPYLIVGWLWYIGTLIPVIGIVQVGSQAMADRYTYVPSMGLFIIIAWGGAELALKWRIGKRILVAIAASIFTILITTAWFQIRYWKNSITLFKHAIDITENNYVAYNNLGLTLAEKGRLKEAVHYYSEGLKINPHYIKLHNNLGDARLRLGNIDGAIDHFKQALRIKPTYAKAHFNMGTALLAQDKLDDAIRHFNAGLQTRPNDPTAHNNLGNALQKQGRLDEAMRHYRAALRVCPKDAVVYNNLGVVLMRKGDIEGAMSHFKNALRIQPEYTDATNNLKTASAWKGGIAIKQREVDESPPIGQIEQSNR